ncbi:MAG: carboxypeptidase-like regulatory domain-containing protein [Planctomycetota bacterium]
METPRRRGIGSLLFAVIAGLPLAAQQSTVTLGGRVVDARGEPLPAARVWVTEVDDIGRVLARGFTDADGVFRVPRVPLRDSWEVFACGDGWSVTRATAWSSTRPVLLTAQPALRLGGTLRRADGSPAVGVEVRGIAFALKPPIDEFCVTDAEGRWRLDHLRPGPVSLVAAVPGEGLHACNGPQLLDDDDVQLRHGEGRSRELTVQLRGMPAAAAGKVFVELQPENGFAGLPRPWHHAALDAAGEVTLTELPSVAYRVKLLSHDVLFAAASVEIPPDTAPRTVTFDVLPEPSTTRSLQVRLHDAAGHPLPGVRLRLDVTAPPATWPSVAVTDQEGVAIFDCLVTTDARCAIWSEDPAVVVLGPPVDFASFVDSWMRHLCRARADTEVVVVGAPAVHVCGRVLDVDGVPDAGQLVELVAAADEPGAGMPLTSAVTGPDGCFAIPVRAGDGSEDEFVVAVGGHEFACMSRRFELPEGRGRCEVGDLRLPVTGRLEVQVTGADGEAAKGAVVEVLRPTGKGSWLTMRTSISGEDGRVSFVGLMPGERQVALRPRAGQGGWPQRSFTVESGKTVEVQLTMPR